MEKVHVNNQIVLMRKPAKQAKVHLLRRLIKQMERLKKKKGTEQQLMKYQRKVDRLHAEINSIKKMKLDEISKQALQGTDNWNDVIKQKTILPADRARARLCAHDAIQKIVLDFRKNNPTWQSWVIPLLNMWQQKKKQKKETPTVKMDMKEASRMQQVPGRIAKDATSDANLKHRDVATVDIKKEDNLQDLLSVMAIDSKISQKVMPLGDDEAVTHKFQRFIPNTQHESMNKVAAHNKFMEIQRINLASLDGDIMCSKPVCEEEIQVDIYKPVASAQVKDSFFCGSVGESETSDKEDSHSDEGTSGRSSLILSAGSQDSSDKYFRHRERLRLDLERKGRGFFRTVDNRKQGMTHRNSSMGKGHSKPPKERIIDTLQTKRSRGNHGFKAFWQAQSPSKGRKRPISETTISNRVNENEYLHPSWEAKKKQSSQLLPFQGKKVTFND